MAKTNSKGANWGKLGGNGKMHGFEPVGTQKPGVSSVDMSGGSRRGIEAKGGSAHGFYSSGTGNKDYAGTQAAGTTGPEKAGPNNKFAEGGKNSMFGNRGSQRMPSGQSGPN